MVVAYPDVREILLCNLNCPPEGVVVPDIAFYVVVFKEEVLIVLV